MPLSGPHLGTAVSLALVVSSYPLTSWSVEPSSTRLVAQIIPDSSLGAESAIVTPEALIRGDLADEIGGGAIRGENLFHSFAEFNIIENQRVYFANPIGIENILSRVTGDNLSNIDGLLGVDGAANLYLLNPNGIIFGPNARLDIQGSFTATTAESIGFADDSAFSATPVGTELLSVSVPLGVQFNDQPQGDITQQGDLTVGARETLTLFGDTVLNSGELTTEGGTVELLGNQVGLVDEARVDVSSATGGGTVLIGGDYLGGGTVPTSDRTLVTTSTTINADAQQMGDGGRVIVWADEVTQFAGSISAQGGTDGGNGGFVEVSGQETLNFTGTVNTQAVNGIVGQLLLDPENILITNAAPAGTITVNFFDGVFADFVYSGAEDAGQNSHITPATIQLLLAFNDLTLEAENAIAVLNDVRANSNNDLTLNASAIGVIASRLQQIGGGNIILTTPQTAGNRVLVSAGRVDTNVLPGATNAGGNIQITTHDFQVTDNSVVTASTLTDNNAGQVQIDATGEVFVDGAASIIASQVGPGVTGSSGGVAIATANLTVSNGAQINSNTEGAGNAGLIEIDATDEVVVDGAGSFIASQVLIGATGDSSGVAISTNNLSILNGAEVTASTFSDGDSGQIQIDATGEVVVDGAGSFIASQVSTGATGNSGGIDISTNGLSVSDGANVSASTGGIGNAGEVEVDATGDVLVDGNGSRVASEVIAGATGDSGGITIAADNLSVRNDAQLTTTTFGDGDAGQININAMRNVLIDGVDSFIVSQVTPGATGDSGGIAIAADNLTVLNDAEITAGTFGNGNAGQIQIDARGNVRIDGANSFITSQVAPGGRGDSGGITLSTNNLSVLNDASLSASAFGDGNSGPVRINAIGDVLVDGLASSIDSQVGPGVSGNSGGVQLAVNNLFVRNGGDVSATTFGAGDAGQVEITANSDVIVEGDFSFIASQVSFNAAGNSGGVVISTDNLEVRNGGDVSASTFSAGNAGRVQVEATGDVLVDGDDSRIASQVFFSGATGDSGGIVLSANNLSVLNRAELNASTAGAGNAGQIEIDATGNVLVADDAVLASVVGMEATGNSGGIMLSTTNLEVLNNAGLFTSTLGDGNAGQVVINARGNVGVDNALINSGVLPGGVGNSGGIVLSANNLALLNESFLSATTFGDGNAGPIRIDVVGDVRVDGDSLIDSAVFFGAAGDSGGIAIAADSLSVLDGSEVNTSTGGAGNAGSIEITAPALVRVDGGESFIASVVFTGATGNSNGIALSTNTLEVSNGGFVSADTLAQGRAGDVVVRSLPTSNLNVNLNNGLIQARTQSSNPSGNLTLQTDGDLTIQGSGEISVESLLPDSGAAGSLNVLGDNVVLDGPVELSAQTASVTGGGAVNFTVDDVLVLRRGSFINAESTNAIGGDGGNIFIDTGFLVGVPGENTDIIANAVGGNGGRVEVNAVNIFGFQESQSGNTAALRSNTTNDLSASSEQGVEGEIALNTLNVDPSSGLGTLPEGPIDASQLIDQTLCEAGQGSNFVVTGQGGLPSSPTDALGGVTTWEDWSFADDTAFDQPLAVVDVDATDPSAAQLVEAQGAMRAADGRIVLLAEATPANPIAANPLSANCRTVQSAAPTFDRPPTTPSP